MHFVPRSCSKLLAVYAVESAAAWTTFEHPTLRAAFTHGNPSASLASDTTTRTLGLDLCDSLARSAYKHLEVRAAV
jgi:hypothetical protein